MLSTGLSAADRDAWLDAMQDSGSITTTLEVLDLDGNHLASLDATGSDGQVLVNRRSHIKRALRLNFSDPDGALDIDPYSPNKSALFFNRMVRINVDTAVPALGDHVSVPPFLGPVTKFRRDGTTVRIEAHGKEALGMGHLFDPLHIEEGTPKTDAIQIILGRTGETRFALPDLPNVLPRPLSLGRYSRPWRVCERIARSMAMELDYLPGDDGYLTMRRLPTAPCWTFQTGDVADDGAGDVIGRPVVTNLMDPAALRHHGFANVVQVLGPLPHGQNKRINVILQAPPEHNMAPGELGRGDTEIKYVHKIEERLVGTKGEATRLATVELEDRLRAATQVAANVLPVYHLQGGDLVELDTADQLTLFRADTFALPIGTRSEYAMSIGYHKNTTIDRADEVTA